MAVAQKQCSKCGGVKPATEFQKNRRECKACTKARQRKWEADNRDRVNARSRAWAAANPERSRSIKVASYIRTNAKERAGQRYHADPSKFTERSKSRYLANPEKVRAYQKDYRIKNRERFNASCRAAKKAKPEKYAEIHRNGVIRRRARKRGLPDKWGRAEMRAALARFNQSCAVCRTPFGLMTAMEWDHWIPLASPSCPGTIPSNMVPLCEVCNLSKSNAPAEQWLRSQFPQRWRQILRRVNQHLRSCEPSTNALHTQFRRPREAAPSGSG